MPPDVEQSKAAGGGERLVQPVNGSRLSRLVDELAAGERESDRAKERDSERPATIPEPSERCSAVRHAGAPLHGLRHADDAAPGRSSP